MEHADGIDTQWENFEVQNKVLEHTKIEVTGNKCTGYTYIASQKDT